MEFILRSRRTGLLRSSIIAAAKAIEEGKSVSVLSLKEDNTGERMKQGIKEWCGIDVEVERVTKKEPRNSTKVEYDNFGEPIGITILPQIDVFAGWNITRKYNGK